MRKRKFFTRLIALILALLMALSLISCNCEDYGQPHSWYTGTETPATCTKDGRKIQYCANNVNGEYCEQTQTTITPALGHDLGITGTVTKQPDCTNAGEETFYCSRCDYKEIKPVPATGHTTVYDVGVDATCTLAGKTAGTYCSTCDTVLTGLATINANGHKVVTDKAESATCTVAGKTEGTHCSVCNTVFVEQTTIPALGHSWDSGVVTTAPTTTATGVKTYTCQRSGCNETKTETVDKLPQSSTTTPTTTPTNSIEIPMTGDNTVGISASVYGSNATVGEITDKALENIISNGKTDTVSIDLSGVKGISSATLTKPNANKLASVLADDSNNMKFLELKLTNASVKLDEKALNAIIEQAVDNLIRIVVEPTNSTSLTSAQNDKLATKKVSQTFEAYVISAGREIHDFKGGSVQIFVKFTPAEGKDSKYYHIFFVDLDGTLTKYDTVHKDGEIGFTTNHLSDYAIIYDETVDSGSTEEQPEEKPEETPSETPTEIPEETPAEKISIAKAVITQDKRPVYTGKQQNVPFTVTLNGKKLTEGVDYTVKTVNGGSVFTAVGKHKVTVTGIGDYTGKLSAYLYIDKASIANAVIKQTKQVLYTGKQQKVPFTVTLNGKKLTEGVDYTVKTVNGNSVFTGVGKHKVTVTGIGNYMGKLSAYVYIDKGNQPLTVSPTSKSYKVATTKSKAQSFTLKTTNAKGKVTYKSSNTKYVTVSAKGKVTIKKGTPEGTYKVTVTAAGNENYNKGSKTVTVTVK